MSYKDMFRVSSSSDTEKLTEKPEDKTDKPETTVPIKEEKK